MTKNNESNQVKVVKRNNRKENRIKYKHIQVVEDFQEIANVITESKTFLIFPHITVDADALGSSVALCETLRTLGKSAYVVVEDRIPSNLDFLRERYVVNYESVFARHDVSICVDCSEESRFPKRAELFHRAKTTICIDHHKTADPFCNLNYIDPTSASTSELIYLLIKELEVEITHKIANNIFAGITSDTGNFQYSNTTKRTHEIVSELYDIKENFYDVSVALYENDSFARLKIASAIFDNARLFANGKGIIARVTQQMLVQAAAFYEDCEGLVADLRAVRGVEVAIFLKEMQNGIVKASLRSKEKIDVAKISSNHNGGGHKRAAGFTIKNTIDEVDEIIVKEVEEALAIIEK